MNILLKIASYLFHPLWMPFAGTLIYFLITPRFFPLEVIQGKLTAIAIMTLFIPIVFYFLLRTIGKVSSLFLENVRERIWPLAFYVVLLWIVLKYVLDPVDYPELYFYFSGILFSTIISLIMVWFNHKTSLHMMGLGGLTTFLIILSMYFNLHLIYTISFLLAVIGLTATARLHKEAHNYSQLFSGFFTGLIPQVAVFYLWWS